jgi:hypothetical protein
MKTDDHVNELVFTLRLLIARAGERDGLAWWESDALSEAGQFVLKRLFPRSSGWAGVESALEAAAIRHRRVLGNRSGVLSLFSLGEAIERAVAQHVRGLRRSGVDLPSLPPVSSIATLTELLRERGGLNDGDLQLPDAQRMLMLEGIEIGRLTSRQAAVPDEVAWAAKRLAAAYTLGEPGSLFVPYVRLTE